MGRWDLDFRQLACLADLRLELQPKRRGHKALQQLLHEDCQDVQIVTPPAVCIRAFDRESGTPSGEHYLRKFCLSCPSDGRRAYQAGFMDTLLPSIRITDPAFIEGRLACAAYVRPPNRRWP